MVKDSASRSTQEICMEEPFKSDANQYKLPFTYTPSVSRDLCPYTSRVVGAMFLHVPVPRVYT